MAKRPSHKIRKPGTKNNSSSAIPSVGVFVSSSSGGCDSAAEVEVTNSCTNPVPVISCSSSPLQVEVINQTYDFEIVCASTDGRPLAFNTGTGALIELDGSVISDAATAVSCSNQADRESISKCMENADGKWQVVSFVDTNNPANIVGPIYCNPQGVVVADPGDLVACGESQVLGVRNYCVSSNPPSAGIFANSATFVGGLDIDTQGSENFASLGDGSYGGAQATPSGTWEHRDYNVGGLFVGTSRTIRVETPIAQNGASLPVKGVETVGGGTTSPNSIIHCLASPVGFWGADVLDLESDATFLEAQVIAYDASLNPIVTNSTLPDGSDIVQFVGVVSEANDIAYVQIVVGDANGGTLSDQLALTNVVYGTLSGTAVQQYCEVDTLENSVKVTTVYNPDGNPVPDLPDGAELCGSSAISVDYEYVRVPVCDGTNNFLAQSEWLDGVITPGFVFFDMLGDEVAAPATYTFGWCSNAPTEYDVVSQPICIDGTISGTVETYTDPATQTTIAQQFMDESGLIGTPTNWTYGTCTKNCFDTEIICYCVQSKGSVKSVTALGTFAKVKKRDTKAGKIIKVSEERRYNCDGTYAYSTYLYQGKVFDQTTWNKFGLTQVDCSSPSINYSPAAVTCASEDVDGVTVVVNCQVFTNDTDPTDSFVQYTLADNYTGIGQIGDVYTPLDDLNVIPCPNGSITETVECFEAINTIDGVANAGDTITVTSVTNAVAGTTYYIITHSVTGSIIYEGTDSIGDAGIDVTDGAAWNGPVPCQPQQPDTSSSVPIALETTCMNVDGIPKFVQPVPLIQNGAEVGMLYYARGVLVTGEITPADPCDCQCEDCSVTACTQIAMFDVYDIATLDPGDTTAYRISDNSTQTFVTAHDHLTTNDGINKSSWYTPIIAEINALPDWTITLVTDFSVNDQSTNTKPIWRIDYAGTGAGELRIEKSYSLAALGNGDAYIIRVDAAGVISTSVIDGGSAGEVPDYYTPIYSACV